MIVLSRRNGLGIGLFYVILAKYLPALSALCLHIFCLANLIFLPTCVVKSLMWSAEICSRLLEDIAWMLRSVSGPHDSPVSHNGLTIRQHFAEAKPQQLFFFWLGRKQNRSVCRRKVMH